MATNPVASSWWRYLRISLRGLIVLVLVFGGGLGWFVNRAKVQLDAVTAIERAGGSVRYEWEWNYGQFNPSGTPSWPKWLMDHIGPNYLAHIAEVDLTQGGSDEQMLAIGKLKSLEGVVIRKSSINATGLAPLSELADLRSLFIYNCQVSDNGLEHLRKLRQLEELRLQGTKIADEELAHLTALTYLKILVLGGTAITDAALAHLEGLTDLTQLALYQTKVTDAGLAHLKGMAHLTFLSLEGSATSDAGLAHLASLNELGLNQA